MAAKETKQHSYTPTNWEVFQHLRLGGITSRGTVKGVLGLGVGTLALVTADSPTVLALTVNNHNTLQGLQISGQTFGEVNITLGEEPTQDGTNPDDQQNPNLDITPLLVDNPNDTLATTEDPTVITLPEALLPTPTVTVFPTAAPTATLVPTPSITVFEPLQFNIGAGVAADDIGYIKNGINDGLDYASFELKTKIGAPIFVTIMLGTGGGQSSSYGGRDLEGNLVESFSTQHPLWLSLTPLERLTAAGHETGHVIEFVWTNLHHSGEPKWANEGFAQYFGEMATLKRKEWSYNQMIDCQRFSVTQPEPLAALNAIEPRPAKKSMRDALLGLLAIDYLIRNYGLDAVRNFFILKTTQDPYIAFGQAFPVDISTFFNQFENVERAKYDKTPRNSPCVR